VNTLYTLWIRYIYVM